MLPNSWCYVGRYRIFYESLVGNICSPHEFVRGRFFVDNYVLCDNIILSAGWGVAV